MCFLYLRDFGTKAVRMYLYQVLPGCTWRLYQAYQAVLDCTRVPKWSSRVPNWSSRKYMHHGYIIDIYMHHRFMHHSRRGGNGSVGQLCVGHTPHTA